MLLAVFSDSHGNTERMIALTESLRPDAVIFLGDVVRDVEKVRARFPETPFYIVRGNCDGAAPGYEDSQLLDLGGVRIFCAHGHNHGVKYGLDKFGTSVVCSGSRLGLFGHTHRALYHESDGIQIMNPGSIGDGLHPTYGLVEIENGTVNCRILDYKEK